jgi:hypothetical protein
MFFFFFFKCIWNLESDLVQYMKASGADVNVCVCDT